MKERMTLELTLSGTGCQAQTAGVTNGDVCTWGGPMKRASEPVDEGNWQAGHGPLHEQEVE